MSNASGTRSRGDLTERVVTATVSLVLERGLRRLRSADIAVAAGTTESTMFRHFDGLDDILQKTYDYSWQVINERVGRANFDNPCPGKPVAQLLSDLSALWALNRDPGDSQAATLAFLFMRRRTEIFSDPEQGSEQQARFERRLAQLCGQVAASGPAPQQDPGLLLRLLLNYSATVWLTWFCMPTECDDPTREHDLSEQEAQLGVLVLLDRFQDERGNDGLLPRPVEAHGD